MTEPKWTPGPWALDARLPYRVYSDDPTGSIIAGCDFQFAPRRPEEKAANARLIAAAPELYDALTAVSDMLFGRPDMVAALRPLMGPAEHAVFDLAAAARAKARGEP